MYFLIGLLTLLLFSIIWRFIRPHFVYWSMVRPPYDDDEGISDEDVVEQELDLDVSKMSITPRDPLSYWISNGLEEPRGMPARIRPSTSPESLWCPSTFCPTLCAARDETKPTLLVLNRSRLLNTKDCCSVHLECVLLGWQEVARK